MQLTKLRELRVAGCSELEELPGVEQVRSLEELDIQKCVKLNIIRGLVQWTKLRTLSVGGASGFQLEDLPGVDISGLWSILL